MEAAESFDFSLYFLSLSHPVPYFFPHRPASSRCLWQASRSSGATTCEFAVGRERMEKECESGGRFLFFLSLSRRALAPLQPWSPPHIISHPPAQRHRWRAGRGRGCRHRPSDRTGPSPEAGDALRPRDLIERAEPRESCKKHLKIDSDPARKPDNRRPGRPHRADRPQSRAPHSRCHTSLQADFTALALTEQGGQAVEGRDPRPRCRAAGSLVAVPVVPAQRWRQRTWRRRCRLRPPPLRGITS